jgi:hypothetical protein
LSEQWYPRLADVADVGYQASPRVDRSKLPGFNERPATRRYRDQSGRSYVSLMWGDTSEAPARRHSFLHSASGRTPDALLTNLAEALELPGTPSDYHFAIQATVDALWRRRRQHPEMLERVEHLAWLDLRLAQACPTEFQVERPEDPPRYYRILAFKTLRVMYEREGALREALEVERIAAEFDQGDSLELLEAKIAAWDGEGTS